MAHLTRTEGARASSMRPAIGGNARGLLDLDGAHLDTAKFDYMWATESVFGADMRENVRTQMATRGFVPVMASEMPTEAPPLLPGEERKDTDCIRRGGCVLMKRPRRVAIAERAELAEQNAEALRSVNRDFRETVAQQGAEIARDSGVREQVERGNRPKAGAFAE
jgi:hypothetical protein